MGTFTRCQTDVPSLGLQYGTLVALRFMGIDESIKIISIAAWIYDAALEESRIVGEAVLSANDGVRVNVEEKHLTDGNDKRADRVKKTYVLYRVGSAWFIYDARFDHDLFKLPQEEEEEG